VLADHTYMHRMMTVLGIEPELASDESEGSATSDEPVAG